MKTMFFGIEIGRRALDVHRRALEVTGHNIANATTEGYSRQRVYSTPTAPYTMPGANQPQGAVQLGTGVQIEEVRRMRDQFLDGQVRQESTSLGRWRKSEDLLRQVEVILNEPSESGLRTVLEKFWSSLQDLANNPEFTAARVTVIERGQALADTFVHLSRQLSDLGDSLDHDMEAKVSVINSVASEIASLNAKIGVVSASGQQANDLMDRRDMLLDDLALLAEVHVIRGQDDTVSVFLAGGNLVSGSVSKSLETRQDPDGLRIYWENTNTRLSPRNGEISALFSMRDEVMPEFENALDQLADALSDRLNEIHGAGTGLDGSQNIDFFIKGGASGMSLNPDILADYAKIAASLTGEAGDGENALRMARVAQETLADLSGATPGDFYRSLVAHLGVRTQEATRMAANQETLVGHLEERRQAVQGVSLDEEMTELIRCQHAYAAAARLITAVDEMLDTVVHRLGLVGR